MTQLDFVIKLLEMNTVFHVNFISCYCVNSKFDTLPKLVPREIEMTKPRVSRKKPT